MDYGKWLRSHTLIGNKWRPVQKKPNPAQIFGAPVKPTKDPAQSGFTGPVTGPDESWKDPTYTGTQTNIQTGLKNLGTYLQGQSQGVASDYGLSVKYKPANPDDPNAPLALEDVSIDPNVDVTNPFSRAALLKKAYKQNVAGNTNSMAARGQLYSGALQNAQDAAGEAKLQGDNDLIKGFSSQHGGLLGQWLQARTGGDQALTDAQAAAIERNKNNAPTPAPISPELKDFFATHQLRGTKWVTNEEAAAMDTNAPKPKKAKAPVDPKQFLLTHKLVGNKWVPR